MQMLRLIRISLKLEDRHTSHRKKQPYTPAERTEAAAGGVLPEPA
jgi:hypothetical protein